jgi:hypothetical protein
VIIPWFKNCKLVYLEFYKLWFSPEFKDKSKKKRLNCGNDPKHRYGADGHIQRGQHMVDYMFKCYIHFYFHSTNS